MLPDSSMACLTFYGFDDNDDGCGKYGTDAIAHPHTHKVATEDLGTYERPSTCAACRYVLSPGSRLYVPRLKKYYIMEDDCVECERDWARYRRIHIDLFIGGNKPGGPKLIAREEELTLDRPEEVIFHPGPGHEVITEPLHVTGDFTPAEIASWGSLGKDHST